MASGVGTVSCPEGDWGAECGSGNDQLAWAGSPVCVRRLADGWMYSVPVSMMCAVERPPTTIAEQSCGAGERSSASEELIGGDGVAVLLVAFAKEKRIFGARDGPESSSRLVDAEHGFSSSSKSVVDGSRRRPPQSKDGRGVLKPVRRVRGPGAGPSGGVSIRVRGSSVHGGSSLSGSAAASCAGADVPVGRGCSGLGVPSRFVEGATLVCVRGGTGLDGSWLVSPVRRRCRCRRRRRRRRIRRRCRR